MNLKYICGEQHRSIISSPQKLTDLEDVARLFHNRIFSNGVNTAAVNHPAPGHKDIVVQVGLTAHARVRKDRYGREQQRQSRGKSHNGKE